MAFIYGFCLAYIANDYIKLWENKIYINLKLKARQKKHLSILSAYLSFVAGICLFIFSFVPMLMQSIRELTANLPSYIGKISEFYQYINAQALVHLSPLIADNIRSFMDSGVNSIIDWLSLSRITGLIGDTTSGVFNFLFAIVISLYMLADKENICLAMNRILTALFPMGITSKIKWVIKEINTIISQYFTGKIIQSIIIMIVTYVAFSIFKVPYAVFFAFFIGITNMIPYIGPWIGGFPAIMVSMINDLWLGIYVAICIIIIQLIDNFIINPKVIGGRIGISPLLVIIGISIGGKMFGFPGMIIGDAMAAVVKVLFYDNFIKGRLKKLKSVQQTPLP